MHRIIGFPAVYLQGPGALAQLGALVARTLRVSRAALVVDPVVERLFESFDSELVLQSLPFGGECTEAEVARLAAAAAQSRPGAVIGAGGGKALDTSKAVAQTLDLPLVIVPTAASSDAPTSRLIALYDAQHRIVAVPTLHRNPEIVLVDTSVIARAPRRLFVAGIGDAIGKRYEVAQARAAGITNYLGGAPTELSQLLAVQCFETLKRDTDAALAALERRLPDAAFERVVEATVLYSGLAFEGGGLSIAHGLLRGLTPCPETARSLHGELVAYGLLVQLEAFGHPEAEIEELTGFLARIGLPVSLDSLGLHGADTVRMREIATLTLTAPYVAASCPAVDEVRLVAAMQAVERRASVRNA
jgi:glycerol dehydrogenase